jgi:hypothetical protein
MNLLKLSSTVAAVVVAAALFVTAPSKASADSRSHCQQRVERAEQHYRHELRVHGRHSRQAEDAKARLNNQWEHCWNEAHGWYDPHRREWRTDRDWDRNYDWDHDRDDHDRDDRDRR